MLMAAFGVIRRCANQLNITNISLRNCTFLHCFQEISDQVMLEGKLLAIPSPYLHSCNVVLGLATNNSIYHTSQGSMHVLVILWLPGFIMIASNQFLPPFMPS